MHSTTLPPLQTDACGRGSWKSECGRNRFFAASLRADALDARFYRLPRGFVNTPSPALQPTSSEGRRSLAWLTSPEPSDIEPRPGVEPLRAGSSLNRND